MRNNIIPIQAIIEKPAKYGPARNTESKSYTTKVLEFGFKAAKGHAKTHQMAQTTV